MQNTKKILAGFRDKVLGNDFSLEHIIFLCGAAAGIVLSAFGAVSNFLMELHFIAVLIPLINLIVDVTCVLYSVITRRWQGAAVFVFAFASLDRKSVV